MFSHSDMVYFAREAWGTFGVAAVVRWRVFNERYFSGELQPVPLIITYTQPYGRRLAFCSYSGAGNPGRTITVNVPKLGKRLVADNGVLLHEMIHQCLFERNEDAAHASNGWRREIMRLHLLITGKPLWAGESKVVRREGKLIRINVADTDGNLSLIQGDIARWPNSVGIQLGALGEADA